MTKKSVRFIPLSMNSSCRHGAVKYGSLNHEVVLLLQVFTSVVLVPRHPITIMN